MAIDYAERIPNNVNLSENRRLQRALEQWQPGFQNWWAEMGPAGVASNRLTLITGPSRTADIEKRIVLGVHGPKSLHVIVVWPRDD